MMHEGATMLDAHWIVKNATTDPCTISGLEHGESFLCRCYVLFSDLGDRKITEVQDIGTTQYLLPTFEATIADNVVSFPASFKGFTRNHGIDLAVITETPTGTRGGIRVKCVLSIEANAAPKPPYYVALPDTTTLELHEDTKYVMHTVSKRGIAFRFTDVKYKRAIHRIEHVSIVQLHPELDPEDPYRGPIIEKTEILNDGSGIAVWFTEPLRDRHNYRLSIDTDVTSMRNIYMRADA